MVACAVLAAGWLGGWLRGTLGRAEKRERKRKIPFPVKLRIGGKRIRFFQKKKFDLTQGGKKNRRSKTPLPNGSRGWISGIISLFWKMVSKFSALLKFAPLAPHELEELRKFAEERKRQEEEDERLDREVLRDVIKEKRCLPGGKLIWGKHTANVKGFWRKACVNFNSENEMFWVLHFENDISASCSALCCAPCSQVQQKQKGGQDPSMLFFSHRCKHSENKQGEKS